MRFNEQKNIQEALEYIMGTYGEHYANDDKHQLMDDIIESGEDLAFNRWNAIKYLKRYGKKAGFNRKDLLKAIHYAVLLLYHNDQHNAKLAKPDLSKSVLNSFDHGLIVTNKSNTNHFTGQALPGHSNSLHGSSLKSELLTE